MIATILLVVFALLSMVSVVHGANYCSFDLPGLDVAFNLSASKQNITVTSVPTTFYGAIKMCFHTMQTSTSAVKVSYTVRNEVEYPGAAITRRQKLIEDGFIKIPPNTQNISLCWPLQQQGGTVNPSHTCVDYPMWCSSEVNIDFNIVFSAPGRTSAVVGVCCLRPCVWGVWRGTLTRVPQ